MSRDDTPAVSTRYPPRSGSFNGSEHRASPMGSSAASCPRGNLAQTRRCPGWGFPRPGLRCAGAVLACRPLYEGLAASFWAVVVPAPKFGISSSAGTRRECQSPRPDRTRVTPARTKLTIEAIRAIWPICHQP